MAADRKVFLKLAISLGITFFLALLFLSLIHSKTYQILESKAYDLRFFLRGKKLIKAPVLHIDIDDQSLDKLGRWPWPRSFHAQLVDTLAECGARAVIFDVLFTEKQSDRPEDDALFAASIARSGIVYLSFYFPEDRIPPAPELKALLMQDISLSPEDAARTLKADPVLMKEKVPLAKRFIIDEVVSGRLRVNPEISLDEIFRVVEDTYGWFLFPSEDGYIRENFNNHKLARFFVNKFSMPCPGNQAGFLKKYRGLVVPIREYIEGIRGSGYINADRDFDGVLRRIPLFMRRDDRIFPQLSLKALMDMLEVKEIAFKPKFVIMKNAHKQGMVKDIVIPTDENGSMLINWSGKWAVSYAHVPYYIVMRLQDVRLQLRSHLEAAVSRESPAGDKALLEVMANDEKALKEKLTSLVKDKICIVGLTATGTQDLGAVPLETNYPMVGTHSNLIDTILRENFIRRAGLPLHACIFIFTSFIIGISSLLRLWRSVLLTFCYAAGYFWVACWLFGSFGIWIDMVGTFGIVLFGFTGITGFRYFTEEKEKLWIKHAFGYYLSKEVINELMNDPAKLKLGGERKQISVIFSDVRGFTSFSEGHQPEEVVAMLNEILNSQVEILFKHNGTLDKFVGDEMMAFFGAPGEIHKNDHALMAVRTAVEIQAKMVELQTSWANTKKDSLAIGVGINSGDMVVGNMGSLERMDYTVIGDNVNLAARLCSAAGKNEILISEFTYERVKDHVVADALEPITVKGKAKPVNIYRVTGLK
ncbi:MAG: adenylate/guanylate cyclase domain-containing protein [Candidatus Omnitrophica bacterium]|nr:adenylate/guanylate cyclase domain-containing protein [Candidatus Omnitrophota bacterium]